MNEAEIFIKKYFREIAVLATAVVIVSVFSTLAFVGNQTPSDDGIPKAAIIDQLYDEIPSPYFQPNVTEYFETAGYDVDIYTTKDITVDFYKRLPSMDYEFIVIRSHASAYMSKLSSMGLFTGEKYSPNNHSADQLTGHLTKAVPYNTNQQEKIGLENLANQTYFAIGPKFVDEKMVGEFPGSVIVLAGCYTASTDRLSQSLIDRGASVVVGWDDNVLSTQNDKVILALLEKMLVNGEAVPEAVSSVTNEFRLDQEPVQLRYYNKVLEIESDDLLDELEIESDDLLDELEIESDDLLDEPEITNQPRMIIGT